MSVSVTGFGFVQFELNLAKSDHQTEPIRSGEKPPTQRHTYRRDRHSHTGRVHSAPYIHIVAHFDPIFCSTLLWSNLIESIVSRGFRFVQSCEFDSHLVVRLNSTLTFRTHVFHLLIFSSLFHSSRALQSSNFAFGSNRIAL